MSRYFKLLCFFMMLSVSGISSCSKSNPTPESSLDSVVSSTVALNVSKETLYVEDDIIIVPIFTPTVENPSENYTWKVANAQVAEIIVQSDFSVRVVGKSKGETEVILSAKSGEKLARCSIVVLEKTETEVSDDGVVKILAIGNSFSEDALEHYLYGLANAAGHKIVIGNLYIGGATLSLHVQHANSNAAAYSYRKINEQGVKTTTANTSIETALLNENWDYISFQQASPNSGQFGTFSSLADLYNYVKIRTKNSKVKYILHQTWAYAKNSTHSGFANYSHDQEAMYSAIVDAYTQARGLIPTDKVIPVGTAIQNGRTSVIGDNFCRDGYHLDLNIGRYTASCTWFEALFEQDVIGNTYKPSALTDYEVEIAQHAAHFAVQTPDKVTPMLDYQPDETVNLKNPVLVNFGQDTSSPGWNTLTSFTANTSIPNLADQAGNYTNISITITERFSNRNKQGPTSTTTVLNMPAGISSDSYYGNSGKIWEDKEIKKSTVKLEGLNKDKKYNFCFFGSRDKSGNENRETKYIVSGANEVVTLLDAANNIDRIACADNVQPNANGEIVITITAGDKNDNEYGFYYLGALKLTQVN